ncbi:MAG TPA: exosortase-dependent surface protein XDP2 [Chroococcidiopsis sp.]
MMLKSAIALTGLLAGGLLTLGTAPAQAFSFTTNTAPGSNAPKGNILLQSVTLGSGEVVDNFAFVNSAQIIYNDAYKGGNSGAASSDRGDNATGIKNENPVNADIVASLGNNNLNNIIDTEDQGKFTINVFFSSVVDKLFFWERGQNSKLGVQAVDASGNLLGTKLVMDSAFWGSAGYSIDTTEIVGAQRVGSLGVSLADLGVSGPIAGVQLTSLKTYNGPDFKVVGAAASVPEPATVAGIVAVAGAMAASRRRKAAKQA